MNQVRKIAEGVGGLPSLERSSDPADDYILALAEAGNADFLVTGGKDGLLRLKRHKGTHILSARDFVAFLS